MHLLAAFALLAAPTEPAPALVERVAAERQAVAVVRILPGAAVRFSEIEETAPGSFTDAQIRGADGSLEPARLVEFH